MVQQLGVNGYVECRTRVCDREARPPERPTDRPPLFCCMACGLSHLGDYPIDDGPLPHSETCAARWVKRTRSSWGESDLPDLPDSPPAPVPDICPHGFHLQLETCEICEPETVRPPRALLTVA